jgi:hypothetical protein
MLMTGMIFLNQMLALHKKSSIAGPKVTVKLGLQQINMMLE